MTPLYVVSLTGNIGEPDCCYPSRTPEETIARELKEMLTAKEVRAMKAWRALDQ